MSEFEEIITNFFIELCDLAGCDTDDAKKAIVVIQNSVVIDFTSMKNPPSQKNRLNICEAINTKISAIALSYPRRSAHFDPDTNTRT